MTEDEMKDKILQAIEEAYKAKFVGKLKATKNDINWTITIYLRPERPTIISAELSDEQFIKYFIKELHDRNWDCTKWFIGYQMMPYNPVDSACCV